MVCIEFFDLRVCEPIVGEGDCLVDYLVMNERGYWHIAIWDIVQEAFLNNDGDIVHVLFWAPAPSYQTILNNIGKSL